MHFQFKTIVTLSVLGIALSETVIRTKDGSVRGFRKVIPHEPGSISVFYGIPYAKPPLGELRFRKPQLPTPWSTVLDATKKPNSCLQTQWSEMVDWEWVKRFDVTTDMSEDCLYLNVWTPAVIQNEKAEEQNLPVIFWIHGGGFISGGSMTDIYDGSYITLKEKVIFVSLNYRLGPLGFLYLGNEEAPGNMGLYDMVMALDWVKNNIQAFGGDPNLVTIIGESAGGASVSALLLSPLSRDKFKYAVIQSGTMLSTWSHSSKKISLGIAKSIYIASNCTEGTTQWDSEVQPIPPNVIECLRKIDGKNLVHAMATPTIDGYFFPATPFEMLATRNFKADTKILSGHTSKEGAAFALNIPGYNKYLKMEEECFVSKDQAREMIKIAMSKLSDLGIDLVHYVYSDWTRPGDNTNHRDNIVDLLGDLVIVCPTIQFAKQLSYANTVYYYQFNHRPNINKNLPLWTGAMHTDEIQFFLGSAFNRSYDFSDDDRKISTSMMNHLGNFVRTGSPTSKWPSFTTTEQLTHVYGFHNNQILGPRARQCAFFSEILPKLMKDGNTEDESEPQSASANSTHYGFIFQSICFVASLCSANIIYLLAGLLIIVIMK